MPDKSFLNPTLVVDIVLFTIINGDLQVLLINREGDPFKGLEALPGGYLLAGENTKTAAVRVLKEKAGVSDIYIEQLYTFDEENRDPRGPVFSVTYLALVSPTTIPETKGTQHPKWFSTKKLPKLAFDHKKIIEYAKERLAGKVEYTTIAFGVLPTLFTLTQVQQVYEAILEKEIDKRNFRKKIDQLGFLKETKQTLSGMRQRPAKLYTLGTKSKTIKVF
jgi:8-oxo-dGTP diphosphatase